MLFLGGIVGSHGFVCRSQYCALIALSNSYTFVTGAITPRGCGGCVLTAVFREGARQLIQRPQSLPPRVALRVPDASYRSSEVVRPSERQNVLKQSVTLMSRGAICRLLCPCDRPAAEKVRTCTSIANNLDTSTQRRRQNRQLAALLAKNWPGNRLTLARNAIMAGTCALRVACRRNRFRAIAFQE
jgi:hypothetical protein